MIPLNYFVDGLESMYSGATTPTSPLATTQPVASTAPVSGTTPSGTSPYYAPDGSLMIWTGTGYHAIPRIAASNVGDLSTPTTSSLSPDQDWSAYSPDELSAYQTPGFTGWGISNMDPYGGLAGLNPDNSFKLQPGGTQDAFDYWLKSGDKEGSQITFKREGDYYVPTFSGVQGWDTNDADKRVIPLSILLGGGAAVLGGAGAAAGAAASEALPVSASNLSTMWGPAMSTVPGTVAGGATPWTASLGGFAGAGGFGSALIPAGGAAAGGAAGSLLGDMSYESIMGGAAAGVPEGTLSGMPFGAGEAAGAGGLIEKILKAGGSIEDVLKAIGGGGSSGGGGMNILDMLGGAYSANRNRDYATKLMEMFQQREAMQKPFYDKLMESYSNPNAYFEGPEYQAQARVRGNQVNRGDSRTFTNSVDREKLMQDHAASSIKDYRQGLSRDMMGLSPAAYADAYAKGAFSDAYANTPIWAAMGNNGGSLEDLWKTGTDLWDIGTDVFDWFGDLFA